MAARAAPSSGAKTNPRKTASKADDGVENAAPSDEIRDTEQQAEAPAYAPPPPVERQVVTRRGWTTIWVTQNARPWTLPLDALVIPISSGGGAGSLAQALLADVRATHPDLEDFGPPLSEPRHLTPEEPIVLPRSVAWVARGLPARLVLATAEREERARRARTDRWSAEHAGNAARAVVELANREGWARIAIPLLGSGAGGLDAALVAQEVLGCVLAALPAPNVREITLVTLDAAAVSVLAERAHARSQSFANDLPAGDDLLDVEAEVAALAEAILLRDFEPPLVVGVLGGWGSGKSFVMHLMRERISAIRALCVESADMAWGTDREHLFPYVGHPYVITFDAWTYANADLWASLMQTVFRELNRQLTLEAKLSDAGVDALLGGDVWKALAMMNDPERVAILAADLADKERGLLRSLPRDADVSDELWKRLLELRKEQIERLEAARAKRRRTEARLAEARQQLEATVAQQLAAATRRAAWAPFAAAAGSVVTAALKRLAPDGEEALGPRDVEQLKELKNQVHLVERLWSGPRGQGVAFLAFVAVAAAATQLVDRVASVQGLAALVAGATAVWRMAQRWQGWFAGLSSQYERQRQAEEAQIPTRRVAILAQLPATKVVADLEREARVDQAEEVACQEKIGTPAGFVSLAEFVQARLDASTYESKLGLMHQVQRDFASLSDCLVVYDKDLQRDAKTKLFPRGPARVVLFIDDLDRCPPDQVVAVLEAVQLLVKTRLFVVVLAMDVRYVTRALEKRYEKILWRHGDPSGLDYIEKIVQIPYRVRPIETQAFAPFVRAQMRIQEPAPESTGGPTPEDVDASASRIPQRAKEAHAAPPRIDVPLTRKVLHFSREEFDIVRECCAAVELSPRSVKRVVNVYKLLKIVWYRGARYEEPKADCKRALVMLLALAARHPEAMRDVLDDLSEAVTRRDNGSLHTWLRDRCREHGRMDRRTARWTELATSLAHPAVTFAQVSVDKVGAASCNLVRSFSFLGDIGAEPDEMLSPGGNRGYERDPTAKSLKMS